MNSDTKKQIAQQIITRLESVINILGQYERFIKDITINYREKLIQPLIVVQGGRDIDWDEKFQNAETNASYCSELIEKLKSIKSNFEKEEYVQSIMPQYLQLVNSEINAEIDINTVGGLLPLVIQKMDDIFNESHDYNNKRNVIQNLTSLLNHSNDFSLKLLQKLAQLDTFEYFKSIEHSVVIVGANGSGKSSFSRNARKVLSGNIAIISAQKIFAHHNIENIPLGEHALQKVHSFQSSEKLGKNLNNQNEHGQDLQNLILSLIAEHHKQAEHFYSGSKINTVERQASLLEQVIQVWKEIIVHRCMKYETSNLTIYPHNGKPYDFTQLSDGEKAIFYYISHIILAKKDSFIIIDEPENHLHMGIVSKLWDKLEILRKDCKFIYLTHNLDFASSRVHANKFWSKKFTAPAKWEIVPLPVDEDLPETLLMELLGSRKKIIFCEGEKSSLDYKLYSMLFSNYTIKPVGGHLDVINYTRAFNKSKKLFGNTAIGIIDGDFHPEKMKLKWEADSIFCIEAHEAENLLCDEELLEAANKHFYSPDDAMNKAKNQLFKKIEQDKILEAVAYASQKINHVLKSNLIEKPKTIDELKNKFQTSIKTIDIDAVINERLFLLNKIILDQDYNAGVRHFNHKGLVSIIGNEIVDDYKNRILVLLKEKSSLLQKLKEKYCSKITFPESEETKDEFSDL
jgi:ABC-type cobalamin/Fe3+-siderophores transport system ATPase subunit